MLTLKGCPRCQGDMNTNKDMYGEYMECLQCGYKLRDRVIRAAQVVVSKAPEPAKDNPEENQTDTIIAVFRRKHRRYA